MEEIGTGKHGRHCKCIENYILYKKEACEVEGHRACL